jgi:hypothetical protein
MEKIKLVFPEKKTEKFDFQYTKEENGETIKVSQIIEVEKYATPSHENAIGNYAVQTSEAEMESLNEDSLLSIQSYSKFEYGFISGVLVTMTNIDTEELESDPINFVDKVVASGLWEKIKSSISNYFDLTVSVEKAYSLHKQEANLESKINKLIDNVGVFVEKISKLDLSPENLKIIIEQLSIGKEKLTEVFPDGVVGKPNQTPIATP